MRKKVLFVVDNLVMGGVTRVLVNLLKEISEWDIDIDLLVFHRHTDMNIKLPDNVNLIEAGKRMSVVDYSLKTLIKEKKISKIISKLFFSFRIKTGLIKSLILKDRKERLQYWYDVEIAFGDGFPYIYTSYGDSKTKIAWMHSDVAIKDYSERYYKQIKNALSEYDKCVAVSEKVAQSYHVKYEVSEVAVIHNIVDDTEIINKSKDIREIIPYDNNTLNFVSVGRLDYSKNYPMLLEVSKKLLDEGFDFKVYIVGDGDDRKKLEQLIVDNGLENQFILLGKKDNPYPYIKNADCFLLSSRYEGLPTVIIEALILGVPCISTDVAGIGQLLEKEYGLITQNNAEAFCNGVRQVLEKPEMLEEYKRNLTDYKYNNDCSIRKIWEILS